MATKNSQDSPPHDIPSGKDYKIGVVVSMWNQEVTENLLNGCLGTLHKHNVLEENIQVARVPGSYELPMGARILASAGSWDAVICLGCVIKGQTKHDEYIANAVSKGLMQLSLMINTPVIFGVLTPNNMEQAIARSGGDLGNKGVEAAESALLMARLKENTGSSQSKIGFA